MPSKKMKYKKLLPFILLISHSTFSNVFEKEFFVNDLMVASIFLTQVETEILHSRVIIAYKFIQKRDDHISFYGQHLLVNCYNKTASVVEELLSTEPYGLSKIKTSSVDIKEFRDLAKVTYKDLYPEVCI